MFFQQAYGGTHIAGTFQSRINSMLGNIGAPLRVGDDLEDGEKDEIQNQMPVGDHKHSIELREDPLCLEGAQSEHHERCKVQVSCR